MGLMTNPLTNMRTVPFTNALHMLNQHAHEAAVALDRAFDAAAKESPDLPIADAINSFSHLDTMSAWVDANSRQAAAIVLIAVYLQAAQTRMQMSEVDDGADAEAEASVE